MRNAIAVIATAIAVMATGCTFELRDEGVAAPCGPLEFVINTHGSGLGQAQHDAIVDAVNDFGELVGREVNYLDGTTITYRTHKPGDPILIELTWPDEAPDFLGFASPYITNGVYDGGWMYFNPAIRNAPAGMVHRLVTHELGHMHGLGDVDDTTELMNPNLTASVWGTGDLAGLAVTHTGGCEGAPLTSRLLDSAANGAALTEIDTDTETFLNDTGLTAD